MASNDLWETDRVNKKSRREEGFPEKYLYALGLQLKEYHCDCVGKFSFSLKEYTRIYRWVLCDNQNFLLDWLFDK